MAAQIREQAGNEHSKAREDTMIRRGSLRACATSALLLISSAATPTYAADALRIGLSLSLTGPTAPAGKQVLAGLEIWRDDINEKGGLLGRPVELVYYDDQGSRANAPGIYETDGHRQSRPLDWPLQHQRHCRRHAGNHSAQAHYNRNFRTGRKQGIPLSKLLLDEFAGAFPGQLFEMRV